MKNDLVDEVHRELIVSGGDRSMSRENALLSYRLRVIEGDGGSSRVFLLLVQKFKREKARRRTFRPSRVTEAFCGNDSQKSSTTHSTGSSRCHPLASSR